MSARRQLNQRTMFIVIACVAVVAVVALTIGAITALATRNAIVHQFVASNAKLVNPDRGWQEPIDDIAVNPNAVNAVPSDITLARTFVRLDAYRTLALPKSLLKNVGMGLANAQRQHVGIILRFVYNDGPSVGSQDASQAIILRHVRQLSPILHAHAGSLAGVEAGFIGAWGEWHGSAYGLDTNAAAKRKIVAALGAAVPSPVPILLRYPYDIRALQHAWRNSASMKPLLARIGSHQDCFLASSPDDWGTWGQRGGTVNGDKYLIASLRHALVGGETCNPTPPQRTQCTTALREMKLMHFTYLNRRFEPNSLARLNSCNTTLTNRLGYRLVLKEGTWPRSITRSSRPVTFSIKLQNTGFAAPTVQRKINIVFVRGKTKVVRTLYKDVRLIRPGTRTLKNSLTLPKSMARGNYTLYLAITPTGSSATSAMRTNSTRNVGIELANDNVWNRTLQMNRIGSIRVR